MPDCDTPMVVLAYSTISSIRAQPGCGEVGGAGGPFVFKKPASENHHMPFALA
jgi:hypothetical protein